MKDPHVESLRYELKTVKDENYNAPPLRLKRDDYELNLDENLLTITFFKHFAEVEKAKEFVESFLQSWEIYCGITYGQTEISFNYKDAKVIDRNPIKVKITEYVETTYDGNSKISDEVIVSFTRNKYPEPPLNFKASQDVKTLWDRYQGYKEGKEPLFSMGYFCLTYLESQFKGRDNVSRMLNISTNVLNKLGTLLSRRGADKTARKVTKNLKKSTPKERLWIDQAIRKIIQQLGIQNSGNKPEKLTMSDLPSLKKTD